MVRMPDDTFKVSRKKKRYFVNTYLLSFSFHFRYNDLGSATFRYVFIYRSVLLFDVENIDILSFHFKQPRMFTNAEKDAALHGGH